MKRCIALVSTLLIIGIFSGSALFARQLPTDTRTYIEKKYSGYSGVLHAWVYEGDGCGTRPLYGWLQKCAADYEKKHDGIYIEFETVSPDRILFFNSSVHKPDILFFTPGLLGVSEGLCRTDDRRVSSGLQGAGGGFALPVAMGAYVFAENAQADTGAAMLLPDSVESRYSAAFIALYDEIQPQGQKEIESGYTLDLGLEASAMQAPPAVIEDENAIEAFLSGKCARTVVSQRELDRLMRAREAGEGPSWRIAAPGGYCYTDRFLYASCVLNENNRPQMKAALDFISMLLEEKHQSALAAYGAYSTTDAWIHSGGDDCAQLEQIIKTEALIYPACFSSCWQTDTKAILNTFLSGRISSGEALRRMMVSGLRMNM